MPALVFNGTFTAVVLASLLACAVTTVGILVIRRYEDWGTRHSAYFMSFAAGVLISVSFMHIIPESLEMHPYAPTLLLAGFLGMHLLNRLLRVYACQDGGAQDYAVGIIPTLGIGLHSFIDGIIYSVAFNVSVFTGILAAIGMILHEFPEGIVTFVLLTRGGFKPKRAAIYAFLSAALTTPLGTLLSFPFIHQIQRATLGGLLAISAGVLVYVGASHLLPAVEKENARYSLFAMLAGVLVAVVIVISEA